MLTHIPPWYEPDRVLAEATPHFDGPVVTREAWSCLGHRRV